MTAESNDRAGADRTPTGISVAAGSVAVVGATLVAAALFPAADSPGRLLVVSVATGIFAARVGDLRAVGVVTVLAMATFVGFLNNRFGELTGSADAWAYASLIGFTAALGAGYRLMTRADGGAGDGSVPSRSYVAPPDTAKGGPHVA